MNQNDNLHPKDEALKEFIEATAEQINPNPIFQSELEKRLINAHKPRTGFTLSSPKQFVPMLGWAVIIILLVFGFNWMLRALNPRQLPASNNGPCAVTQPNGSLPPDETVESQYYLGNGQLWTTLWPDGKIIMLPENQNIDGSLSMKWPWWRGVTGPLTIEGHRLDAEAEPLRAEIPEGYGDTGFQVSTLIFPSIGCWEVTGRVGEASLTFITKVVFGEPPPTPLVVIDNNATPTTEDGGYPFRGGKLYLTQPLPTSPAQANVYSLKPPQAITADEARALAERFGIQGEVYESTGMLPNAKNYMITDGKQQLEIVSNRYFTYTADIMKYMRTNTTATDPNAEAIIMDFLKVHGFDAPFSLSNSELYGAYTLRQISPDGLPMQYEFYSPPVMQVQLDENGEVLVLRASPIEYDPNPLGAYGIITAEEALQKLLDDNVTAGKIESVHAGGGVSPQTWYREYPEKQTITLRGYITVKHPIDPGKPPLILMDGATMIIGNTSGMEKLEDNAFTQATGQYIVEDEIRKFEVQSWEAKGQQDYVMGSLRRDGDQIIIVSDDGTNEYPLIDPPADVPLNTKSPESQLAIGGTIIAGKMDWTFIQYFADASQMGGGGGGGGMGFYQLNLSGTPIPIPTPTMVPDSVNNNGYAYTVVEGDTCRSIAEAFRVPAEKLIADNNLPDDCSALTIGLTLIINADIPTISRLDGARGILNITLYSNGDGTMRAEYGFITNEAPNLYLFLEGDNLQELQGYNNKPVEIWGSVTGTNQYNAPVIHVEKYNIPFPDLKPQILKGTEKSVELEGKNAVLFYAEDGTVYAEFTSGCNDVIPVESMAGTKNGNTSSGDTSILVEALAIPDLSFAGYPGICIFQFAPATQANGEPLELAITSDRPNTMPEPPATSLEPPKLTVDQVELIYFTSNPEFGANDTNALELYIQPAWHFRGHYENGDEFDIIVQALKQEFLSPELAPYIQGG
jgi:hypothetical protein